MFWEVILGYNFSTVGAVVEVDLGLGYKQIDVGANLYVKYIIS